MLRAGQPALGQVHGDAGQVGRSVIAHFRRGVAIMAAQLLLLLHGPDRGIHLQRSVKFTVISVAHVLKKLVAPDPAITLVRLDGGADVQSARLLDGHQLLRTLQLQQLLIVGDARQL